MYIMFTGIHLIPERVLTPCSAANLERSGKFVRQQHLDTYDDLLPQTTLRKPSKLKLPKKSP